ncbi:MAG: hypothetical protein ACI80V_003830 [Rhodothermales bacterium]|jgi:hypothetical protein
MHVVLGGVLALGLAGLTVGCADRAETPAEGPAAEASTNVPSSSWALPGWRQTPAEQPAGYEGPVQWDEYLQGRSVTGDFNGDGAEDTAILFERDPADDILESMYGDRAEAAKGFVLEFGLVAFLSSASGEMQPVEITSRVGGIGLYGLDMRLGGDGTEDAIDLIKYDSSNFLYRWNGATSAFDEVPEGD